MPIDASILGLFQSGASDTTTSLLGILYGSGGLSGTGASGQDPIAALQTAETNQTKDVAKTAAQPDIARDIAAFRTAVANAKTPQDVLSNPQALKVLLTANGLGDQVQYTALATKALLSDTSKTGSLASKLSDAQWLSTAKTFDFANKGLTILKTPSVLDSIANGYAQVTWQKSLDQATPGLSNALDFRSRAGTIASVDQILGDPTFRTVVTTALGIPEQIAFQSLTTQEQTITSRIDITKFKSPAYVEQFTKHYLIQATTNANTAQSGSSSLGSITSLFV